MRRRIYLLMTLALGVLDARMEAEESCCGSSVYPWDPVVFRPCSLRWAVGVELRRTTCAAVVCHHHRRRLPWSRDHGPSPIHHDHLLNPFSTFGELSGALGTPRVVDVRISISIFGLARRRGSPVGTWKCGRGAGGRRKLLLAAGGGGGSDRGSRCCCHRTWKVQIHTPVCVASVPRT